MGRIPTDVVVIPRNATELVRCSFLRKVAERNGLEKWFVTYASKIGFWPKGLKRN